MHSANQTRIHRTDPEDLSQTLPLGRSEAVVDTRPLLSVQVGCTVNVMGHSVFSSGPVSVLSVTSP